MTGETDLASMLATLRVKRRPGIFAYVSLPEVPSDVTPEATVVEGEGITVVLPADLARSRGWDVAFEAAWLTLEVHSALEAVGLTAALSKALGDATIPCNVLAGTYHDHVLVPADRADHAIAALESLRSS
ncbi:MAG: ACT domain-containing protein [Acidimicrobiia bacterium]|nr:ACT domain-containing protein [Acidimicrobiia bacterium]